MLFFRLDRANQGVGSGTRSKTLLNTNLSKGGSDGKTDSKATPEEIKDKLEQQLKIQRAAHQQKRSAEKSGNTTQQVIKIMPNTTQGMCLFVSDSYIVKHSKKHKVICCFSF